MGTCGCCVTGIAPTPAATFNRPGLTAVRYRIGTFGSFREAMISHRVILAADRSAAEQSVVRMDATG